MRNGTLGAATLVLLVSCISITAKADERSFVRAHQECVIDQDVGTVQSTMTMQLIDRHELKCTEVTALEVMGTTMHNDHGPTVIRIDGPVTTQVQTAICGHEPRYLQTRSTGGPGLTWHEGRQA